MLTAYVDVRGDGVIGAIVAALPSPRPCPGTSVPSRAGHPVPTAESAAAATAALDAFATLPHNVERVVLLSGGASSLLAAPLPPLTLEHKIDVTTALLRAGAPIDALNCVRKHLSRVKGGRLAAGLADVHRDLCDLGRRVAARERSQRDRFGTDRGGSVHL